MEYLNEFGRYMVFFFIDSLPVIGYSWNSVYDCMSDENVNTVDVSKFKVFVAVSESVLQRHRARRDAAHTGHRWQ